MHRRHFLQTAAAGGFATIGSLQALAADAQSCSDRPFLLSEEGCGRATGYAEADKIVTVGEKTHVAWLDSPEKGFRVRIRTLDRRSGEWSPTYTVGEAHDNHGGPALTVDSQGHLHIVYYPHHHPMRYRRSKRPNDASEWENEIRFGTRCTYPTLLCGPDDTLYFTCRRSFSDRPWQVELWRRRPGEEWQKQGPILESRYVGYAHFQESLAWGPDGRTLHLSCRFHEKTDGGGYGRLQTVAYLQSRDGGQSWRRSDGTDVPLPATAESAEVLDSGGVDEGRVLRAGAIAVDPEGAPRLIYSVQEDDRRGRTYLVQPEREGTWQRTDLTEFLPEEWSARDLVMPGGVTFTRSGEVVGTATLQKLGPEESGWGHPSSEVIGFRSADGGRTFVCGLISGKDHDTAHWLPNIERPTGQHAVPAAPGIIYTGGGPGRKNTDLLANRVFFARASR